MERKYTIIVLAYVDDLLITVNNLTTINVLKANLSHSFQIKDLGRLKKILGLEFSYTPTEIYMG